MYDRIEFPGSIPFGLLVVLAVQVVAVVLVFVLAAKNWRYLSAKSQTQPGPSVATRGEQIIWVGVIAFLFALGWQLRDLGWAGYRGMGAVTESQDTQMIAVLIRSIFFGFRITFIGYIVLCLALLVALILKVKSRRSTEVP